MNVYGGWCVTLPTHVPVLDDLGNIVYEQKTTKHKDGKRIFYESSDIRRIKPEIVNIGS